MTTHGLLSPGGQATATSVGLAGVDATSSKVPHVDASGPSPVYILADPRALSPKFAPFSAKFDARTFGEGVMNSGSATLSIASYIFSTVDINKLVKVTGAAVAGANLKTTIAGVVAGNAILAVAASTNVAGVANQLPITAGSVVFGTDDTTALQACLDTAVTWSSTTAANPALSVRRVDLPQGMALIRQIVFPRRCEMQGCSQNFGNYGTVFGVGFEQTNNSLLYQLWDVNDDPLIFTETSTGVEYVHSAIRDFSLVVDWDNVGSDGIHYRRAHGPLGAFAASSIVGAVSISSSISFPTGSQIIASPGTVNQEILIVNGAPTGSGPFTIPVVTTTKAHTIADGVRLYHPLTWTDGNRANNVAVYGAPGHGWNLAGGMVPGHIENCRAFACAGAGLYMRMAPNGSIADIDNFSADQCGQGGIWIAGASGLLTIGALKIRSLKYESTSNIYRVGAGRGEYAVTFEKCGGLHVDIDALDICSGSGEATAPTGAVRMVAGAPQPILTWRTMTIRKLTGQTGTPVLIDDLQGAKQVTPDVVEGMYSPGSLSETRIFGGAPGGVFRDVVGSYLWNGPGAAGEASGHQVAGSQPVYSLYNRSGGTNQKHIVWVATSAGVVALRTFTDGNVADEDIIQLTRSTTIGDSSLKLGSASANAKLGFLGRTPVTKRGAITTPIAPSAGYVQAEAAAMKTAVDALRQVFIDYGLTA